MKIKVMLKCPDALNEAIERAAEDEIGRSDDPVREAELEEEFLELCNKVNKQAEKWFRYGETVTLEIDTEEDTCVVVPV